MLGCFIDGAHLRCVALSVLKGLGVSSAMVMRVCEKCRRRANGAILVVFEQMAERREIAVARRDSITNSLAGRSIWRAKLPLAVGRSRTSAPRAGPGFGVWPGGACSNGSKNRRIICLYFARFSRTTRRGRGCIAIADSVHVHRLAILDFTSTRSFAHQVRKTAIQRLHDHPRRPSTSPTPLQCRSDLQILQRIPLQAPLSV